MKYMIYKGNIIGMEGFVKELIGEVECGEVLFNTPPFPPPAKHGTEPKGMASVVRRFNQSRCLHYKSRD